MRSRFAPILVLALVASGKANAQTPELNKPATLQAGDVAAFVIQNLLRLRKDLSEPTVVTYEPDPATIDIEILGSTVSVDQAKARIAEYWSFVQAGPTPYLKRRFGVELSEKSFRIGYYKWMPDGTAKPILLFVGGQYIIAP